MNTKIFIFALMSVLCLLPLSWTAAIIKKAESKELDDVAISGHDANTEPSTSKSEHDVSGDNKSKDSAYSSGSIEAKGDDTDTVTPTSKYDHSDDDESENSLNESNRIDDDADTKAPTSVPKDDVSGGDTRKDSPHSSGSIKAKGDDTDTETPTSNYDHSDDDESENSLNESNRIDDDADTKAPTSVPEDDVSGGDTRKDSPHSSGSIKAKGDDTDTKAPTSASEDDGSDDDSDVHRNSENAFDGLAKKIEDAVNVITDNYLNNTRQQSVTDNLHQHKPHKHSKKIFVFSMSESDES